MSSIKKNKYKVIMVWFILMSHTIFAQKSNSFAKESLSKIAVDYNKSGEQIHKHILEVYKEKSTELVFTNDTRYKSIESIFQRLFIVKRAVQKDEKYIKLSSIPLNNKYNQALKKSNGFNLKKFNPLQYQLDFFSKKKNIYRIDNTYVLVLLPSNH